MEVGLINIRARLERRKVDISQDDVKRLERDLSVVAHTFLIPILIFRMTKIIAEHLVSWFVFETGFICVGVRFPPFSLSRLSHFDL